MIIWSIVLRGNNVKRSSRNNCGTHAIEGEKKMLVRMASGTIEEKIKRTKEGSQHRLSFLTGGVSVHNLCICYYFVFFISEMSLNHTWAIPFFRDSIEIDPNYFFLFEIDQDFWPQKWWFFRDFFDNFFLNNGGQGGDLGLLNFKKMCCWP